MFKIIVVPTDGSEFASRAEDIAISMAKKMDSKVVAVYVIDEKLIYPYDVLEDEGKVILKNVREKGEKDGVSVDESLIFGNPGKDMTKIAEKLEGDLIVIGTHGKTGLEKLLLGSVAENTLKTSKVPVLLVK